ncbi:hypothetical protein SY1_24030 [Fretibacterium fastidiosum]|uniref:Uncharacterized protein n=1 Tax=Fretibacterium fastidiosum TaxID=651822 RepID=A0AB94IYY1_9BACT|nr:hypothetical protein SY1_24030 [Fretibacterium fastidiosum]
MKNNASWIFLIITLFSTHLSAESYWTPLERMENGYCVREHAVMVTTAASIPESAILILELKLI